MTRAVIGLALLCLLLLTLPAWGGSYLISAVTLALYIAYLGLAWNILMGFAGQLSLGHALYVGLGGYTAAALFVHFGISPVIGWIAAFVLTAVMAAVIGYLAFRFGISGVYFALLTIAFAEFTHVGFDHFSWVGGAGGFFLKVANYGERDWLNLRGPPELFFYLAFFMVAGAFMLSRLLLHSRIGYCWLAIREEPEAAQALGINIFRYKMVAIILSAGMTSLAGVFTAFLNNSLFPFQVFGADRSIEIILGPIIGGLGTIFGPILGAFVLTGLTESLSALLAAAGISVPGLKQIFYGLSLALVVIYLPRGIWPSLRRSLRIGTR